LQVILVETDIRKPRIQRIVDLSKEKCITHLITNPALKIEDIARKTYIENLSVITCGPVPPNPSELLNSNRMVELIEDMKEQYDLVIFDSPPLLAVTDAQILSTKVDGTIFVIPQGEVTNEEIRNAIKTLKKINVKVLRKVMNKVEAN